jgi:hypothetical protein
VGGGEGGVGEVCDEFGGGGGGGSGVDEVKCGVGDVESSNGEIRMLEKARWYINKLLGET